jgi:DNA-binding transcriptional MocR family regulator
MKWSPTPPDGGPSVWVRLLCVDAHEFAQRALCYGVLITPGAGMSVDGSHTGYLRLPFYIEPAVLPDGVQRLTAAGAAFTRRPGKDQQLGSGIG